MKYIIKKLISFIISFPIQRRTKLDRKQSLSIALCFLSALKVKNKTSFRQFIFYFDLLFNVTNWKKVELSEKQILKKLHSITINDEYFEPIGCWFTIDSEYNDYDQPIIQSSDSITYYSSGREALLAVANSTSYDNKTVLLPYFTCGTVYQPFIENGWNIVYYKNSPTSKIDQKQIETFYRKYSPSIAVFMEFCGMDLSEDELKVIRYLKQNECVIIVDRTLNIYNSSHFQYVDFYYGSIRKWIPCPDGAFLERNGIIPLPNKPLDTDNNKILTTLCSMSMYINGLARKQKIKQYLVIASVYRYIALLYLDTQPVSERNMSSYSKAILHQEQKNNSYYIDRRMRNCEYIFNRINGYKTLQPAFGNIKRVTSAPLYFHIFAKDKALLAKHLKMNGIDTWSYHMPKFLDPPDKEILYIYEHTLFLPCDQRYTENDMKILCDALEKYEKANTI